MEALSRESKPKTDSLKSKLANLSKSISTKYFAEAAKQTIITILHMHIAGRKSLATPPARAH